MNIEEIKKELYKQKPTAYLTYIQKGIIYYVTAVLIMGSEHKVKFEIPVSDMGAVPFHSEMEAQLLNRWISSF